jgi:dihydroorotate dehydrogenase
VQERVVMMLQSLALPALRRIDPERAHRLALDALSLGLGGRASPGEDRGLAVSAMGLSFTNPIGIAAGFDKDARVPAPLARLGFGFVEAGTVTPLPQAGNPRPRLFRLPEEAAVINRMGFNNHGLDRFRARLERLRNRAGLSVPFGANLGINKNAIDPPGDYAGLVRALAPLSDYLVINLSSPNTPGLRALQQVEPMRVLLARIADAVPHRPPLLVKLAPDLDDHDLPSIVETVVAAGVEGLIVSNTLLARPPGLSGRHAGETGGLSGRPLRARSTAMLAEVARLAAGRLVLVGCGGIETGQDILDKIEAGADLVQVYTRFSIEGPAMLGRLKHELRAALDRGGYATLADARATGLSRSIRS